MLQNDGKKYGGFYGSMRITRARILSNDLKSTVAINETDIFACSSSLIDLSTDESLVSQTEIADIGYFRWRDWFYL